MPAADPVSHSEPVLEVQGITKRFPDVLANDRVDLTLYRGEILALLGENGAGKSTLMNIIYGLSYADTGTLRVRGQAVRFASPREAIRAGIGMVHQHFQLIPIMTVAENVILGEEETVSNYLVRTRSAARETGVFRAVAAVPDGARPQPPERGLLYRSIKVGWSGLWRATIPFIAAAVGLLAGQIILLLVMVISTYLAHGPGFDSLAFQRSPLADKALQALVLLYPAHATLTALLVWTPLVIATVVGASLIVSGYRYARQSWPGRRTKPDYKRSRVDIVVDGLIDLFTTTTSVQNRRRAAESVRELSRRYGLEVDPDALIEKLPVGLQQRVEIIKALYRRADILILDEPTSVLTPQESRELFKIMKDLAAGGVSIIFITHKLKEVFAVADSIVVMRDGHVVGTSTPDQTDEASLAAMMVGRNVMLGVEKDAAQPGEVVLDVKNLCAFGDRKALAVDKVSFDVRAGEVLGIAGVQGNGQTELVEVLTGLRRASSGQFSILGKAFTRVDPRQITASGAAHVPEDRQRYGMVATFSVADNLVINQYAEAPIATGPTWRELPFVVIAYGVLFGLCAFVLTQFAVTVIWPPVLAALNLPNTNPKAQPLPFILALCLTILIILGIGVVAHIGTTLILRGIGEILQIGRSGRPKTGGLTLNRQAIDANAEQLVAEFDIRTPSIATNAGNLSGGNQQKMIVAREFHRRPRLLIASQPTRGIDVGSVEFIHRNIIRQRDEGAAVLLVSAELDEIMALSDRIAVMVKGHIIETLPADTTTREQLGLLMAGITDRKANAAPGRIRA